MSKEKLYKIVENKYKGQIKKTDVDKIKCFYVSKKIFNRAEQHGDIDYMDYAVMAAISVLNISVDDDKFITMPTSVSMILEILGMEVDPRRLKEKKVKESIAKLAKLEIIDVEQTTRWNKSKDGKLIKSKFKMANLDAKAKMIITQTPFKSSESVSNSYLQLPYYAFNEIVYSDNTDKTRMSLLAFYMCQATRNYAPRKSSKKNEESFVDNDETVINYEKVESIGRKYGTSKNTSYKHSKLLKDMGLIVSYKVKLKHISHDFFVTYMTQRHLLPYMQNSINYKIKNGIIIDVQDEKYEEKVKQKKYK